MTAFGCDSEVAPLRRALVASPRVAFQSQSRLAAEWRGLHYLGEPDLELAIRQHDAFATALEGWGVRVEWLDQADGPDAVYTRDAAVLTPRGAVLGSMGKAARSGEPGTMGRWFERAGIPVLGRIVPPARLEGGDLVWLDARTLVVGEGYRTTADGIRQLRAVLGEPTPEIIVVPLPHWNGPEDCFHLMSMLSPVDQDLAVAHSRLLPVRFRQWLLDRGVRLIEVAEEEWQTMGCNVLAVGPRRCVMLDGNPRTRARLEAAGAEVRPYAGSEISRKGCGGPTCLTRPIWRQ
jgi:N-dimethylarginine dimethylaminohydrolase